MHKKWSFPLRIFSVNVTKFAGNCEIWWFSEEFLNGKLHFCAVFVTVVLQNVLWLYPYTDMSTLTKTINHLMLTWWIPGLSNPFMTEVPIIQVLRMYLIFLSIDWFRYDRDPFHERVDTTGLINFPLFNDLTFELMVLRYLTRAHLGDT